VVGLLATLSGTIFIDRTSSASTASVAEQMSALLAQNVAVLLFPEGTSSNGSAVGRFHPSLFDRQRAAVYPSQRQPSVIPRHHWQRKTSATTATSA